MIMLKYIYIYFLKKNKKKATTAIGACDILFCKIIIS